MDTDSMIQVFESLSSNTTRTIILGGLSLLFFLCITRFFSSKQNRKSNQLRVPPAVPGIPLVGNLLQLKERKPHLTFTKWAETYGPIYTIRTGTSSMVVLNSVDVAKEAMVSRYSSISSRKLSNALTLLSLDKSLVIVSDYNDFHKMAKRHIITNVLGANAQKRHRHHRDTMIENIVNRLHAHVKSRPLEAVNFRSIFQSELFGLAMKQAVGREVESLYIKELGTTWSKNDIFKALVMDFMEGSIDVDWRDFFPYLRWIPNKSFERKIEGICFGRRVVMKALIEEGKKRIEKGERRDCYMDYLLSEEKTLTEDQLLMLVWEEIIETSDTSIVTTEWAMFELAKDQSRQKRLVLDIENVCGTNKLSEENLAQIPYIGVIFHETLRRYSPGPIIPLRYVHEDTQLGGYFIPAGSQIAINIYGCNMDKKLYENPEEWRPERYLDAKYDPADMFKTMSFGAGKRVCAGTLQAMSVVCTTIGRLVQEFEWNLKSGETENIDTVAITTRKLEPFQAVLKPRAKYDV